MAMVSVLLVAVYRQIWVSGQSVWSEGWQPPGARAALAKWTGWAVLVLHDEWPHNTFAIGQYIFLLILLTHCVYKTCVFVCLCI